MLPNDLPRDVHSMLRTASENAIPRRQFVCRVFPDPEWNTFVEMWLPKIHAFVEQALGPYGREPLPEILALEPGMHISGATASFDPGSGQVRICPSVQGKAGQTLEKFTHEFTHGSLALFPEGDPFYEEGFVDFSTWLMSHAPFWEPHRLDMVTAAEFNIDHRRERAYRDLSDYERKRWAGGLYASMVRGPYILSGLRMKKLEGNYTWLPDGTRCEAKARSISPLKYTSSRPYSVWCSISSATFANGSP